MRSSFDKVVLVHKGIIKSPAYSRIQGILNCFRDKVKTYPSLPHLASISPFLFA